MQKKSKLSLADAMQLSLFIQQHAEKNNWHPSIVIVDHSTQALLAHRHELAKPGTLAAAEKKALCAHAFQMPTATWGERLAKGEHWVTTMPGVIAAAGGVPIEVDGEFIGAVGVSGSSQEVDHETAQEAVQWFCRSLKP